MDPHHRRRQRSAQARAMLGAENRIQRAPDQERRRRERQLRTQTVELQRFVENAAPQPRWNCSRFAPFGGKESGIHGLRVGEPINEKSGVWIDGILKPCERTGQIVLVFPRFRCRRGRDQHDAPYPRRPVLGKLLRHQATERMPNQVDPRQPQRVEQQHEIQGQLAARIPTLGPARAAVSAQIDEDQAIPPRQIRDERRPTSGVVGEAVDKENGSPLRVAEFNVGKVDTVGQRGAAFGGGEGGLVDNNAGEIQSDEILAGRPRRRADVVRSILPARRCYSVAGFCSTLNWGKRLWRKIV